MVDDPGLIAAIAADRDADAPRLIFADWLDDQGEGDRAAFIRAQVYLAALEEDSPEMPAFRDEQATLLRRHIGEWNKGPSRWGRVLEWHRGFPRTMAIDAGQFAAHHEMIFRELPGLERLQPRSGGLEGAANCRGYNTLHGVSLAGLGVPLGVLRAWDDWGFTEQFNWLDLSGNVWSPDELLEFLAAKPFGNRLGELDLSGMRMPMRGAVLAANALLGLKRLHCLLDEDHIQVRDGYLDGLSRLETLSVRPTAALLAATQDSPAIWRFVTNLDLSNSILNSNLRGVIQPNLPWTKLRAIDLRYSTIGLDGVDFDRASELPLLSELNVERLNLEDRGVEFISSSPLWPNLITLGLANNSLTDRAAKALIAARPRSRLLTLDLSYNPISPPMRAALREAFGPGVCIFNESRRD